MTADKSAVTPTANKPIKPNQQPPPPKRPRGLSARLRRLERRPHGFTLLQWADQLAADLPRAGVGDHDGYHPSAEPATATRTQPHSPEREAVVIARVRAGECVARPGDAWLLNGIMGGMYSWLRGTGPATRAQDDDAHAAAASPAALAVFRARTVLAEARADGRRVEADVIARRAARVATAAKGGGR